MELNGFDCTGRPGFAAGIYEDGQLVNSHCSGLASVEFGVPIGRQTPMNLGSVSKQFTAWAIALLEDAGELSFEDAVTRHLPVPETGATLLDLANHTSPFVDYPHWYYLAGSGSPAGPNRRTVAAAVNDGILIAPNRGAGFLYSNTGYTMLAEVVRRVSGETLPRFAGEYIFGPLGMTRTGFRDDVSLVMPGRASAYDADGTHVMDIGVAEEPIGPGGVYTTLEDWAFWEQNARANRLGANPESVVRRLTGSGGDGQAGSRYHCGIRRTWLGDVRLEGHLGGYLSYTATMLRARASSLLVMANGPEPLAFDVGNVLAASLLPEPVVEGYRPAPGVYRNAETGFLRRVRDNTIDDGRTILALGPAAACDETRQLLFFDAPTGFREVCLGPSYDLVFERLVPATTNPEPGAYVGTYYAPRLDRSIRVEARDPDSDPGSDTDTALVMVMGGERRPMQRVSDDIFDVGGWLSARFVGDSAAVNRVQIGTNRVPVVDYGRVE